MTPERWQEIRRAFSHLVRLDSARRREELGLLAGRDPELADELRSLLHHDRVADTEGYLDEPPEGEGGGDSPLPVDHLPAGTRIGHYAIRSPLGRGGMGAVYLADRVEDYEQQVALKLITTPLTAQALRRFRSERQLLAGLEHPNIVRLLDGGVTGSGGPYLVMECVPGVPIDVDCDRERRSIADRVRLVLAVAEAVAYAHDQGVVHRDLKPSNVLVAGDGTPKVTDFGLARSDRRPAAWTSTGDGAILGTPGYIAPERIVAGPGRNLPAVDVYGLGAILYRLLAGRSPFEADTPLQSCLRATTEPPPSPRRLDRRIPRDLDTIVLRAMARDPAERLHTAEGFAEQLRLFLADRPLTIRPPFPWTRLGKWGLRRRKELLVGGVVGSLLVATTVGGLLVQNRRLDRSETRQRQVLNEVALVAEQFAQGVALGSEETHQFFRGLVTQFEATLDHARVVDPVLIHQTALMHLHLARSHAVRSEHEQASVESDRSVAMLAPLPRLAPDYPRLRWARFALFRALNARADARRARGEADEALADAERARDVIRGLVRDEPGNPDWLDALASQHRTLSIHLVEEDLERAAREAEQALELASQVAAAVPRPRHTLHLYRASTWSGYLKKELGRWDEAERSVRSALDLLDSPVLRGGEQWDVLSSRVDGLVLLGDLMRDTGRPEQAEAAYLEALADVDRLEVAYPAEHDGFHLRAIDIRGRLAGIWHAMGHVARAAAAYRSVIDELEGMLRERPWVDRARAVLANVYSSCPVESLRDAGRAHDLADGDRDQGSDVTPADRVGPSS